VHDSVAFPELVMLPGSRLLHVRPAGTLALRVTVPVKPFSVVRETIEDPEDPREIFAGELALIPKSWKLNVATAVRVREPFVPEIVRG